MFKQAFKNIKTTLAGAFAGLPLVMDAISHKDLKGVVIGVSVFLIGLFSKDHNK
jgi:hypothetical protein